MKHKIVCWSDYAIPVPIKAQWIAQDEDGVWWWYTSRPLIMRGEWRIRDGDISYVSMGMVGDAVKDLIKPEPGPWRSQLYWIGD